MNVEQLATQQLREQGIECTPNEVREIWDNVCEQLRANLRNNGIRPPESEGMMVTLVREVFRLEAAEKAGWEWDRIKAQFESNRWHVICPGGGVVKRYETEAEALADLIDRISRASEFGVSDDYKVRYVE